MQFVSAASAASPFDDPFVLASRFVDTADGHITRTRFLTLPADIQARIDPHFVADDRPLEEQFAGQPMPGEVLEEDYLAAQAASESGGGSAITTVFPDFIPRIDGTPFIDLTEQPGRVLLRFGTAVGNGGAGPAILVGGPVNADGTQVVYQRIYNYDSVNRTYAYAYDRVAGRFVYHAGHSHVYFEGYARYRLLKNEGGVPGGLAERSDGTQVLGDKVGFCLINISSTFTLPNGQSSSTLPGYYFSTSGGPNSGYQPSTGCGQLQGIHVGHEDVYGSYIDGQWVDVTGVPAGNYFLEISLDADNAISESDESNNVIYRAVTLGNTNGTGGVQADRFDEPGDTNNSIADAVDLGEMGFQNVTGLTIHASFDDDYFKFTAASSGTGTITSTAVGGDLDLYLYDANGNELDRSTSPGTGGENVSIHFIAGQTYYIRANGFNEGTVNNYQLSFQIRPTVNLSPDATARETDASPTRIAVTRNGPLTSPLTVGYSVSGSASAGSDYNVLSGTLTFGVESAIEYIDITPVADAEIEAAESIIITINTGATFVAGGTNQTTVTLRDTAPTASFVGYDRVRRAVDFDFSLDVSASLAAGDLLVTGPAGVAAVSQVIWDAGLKRASFILAGVPELGTFVATASASNITHALGEPLAADIDESFFVLPGDADGNNAIDFADLLTLARNFGRTDVDYTGGDFDYDGEAGFSDVLILARSFGHVSPLRIDRTPDERVSDRVSASVIE